MADRIVSASDFKARCLALLDRVAETGERIVVTKHGKAVAMVTPLDAARKPRSLRGSVTYVTDRDEDLFSTGETWEASGAQP
jgi:prevent-host-death family protein